MKKVLCILLSILFVILAAAAIVPPLSSLNTTKSPSFGAYKHVFIVGAKQDLRQRLFPLVTGTISTTV